MHLRRLCCLAGEQFDKGKTCVLFLQGREGRIIITKVQDTEEIEINAFALTARAILPTAKGKSSIAAGVRVPAIFGREDAIVLIAPFIMKIILKDCFSAIKKKSGKAGF